MSLYNLNNPYDLAQFAKDAEEAKRLGGYVELKRRHPQRSLAQNKYLHLLLGYFASEFGYSLEQVKFNIFKLECNRDLFVRGRENKRGETVTYIRSSTELTTDEMTIAIERFRNYSASVCDFYLPEANEQNALLYAQQQVERNREFL